MTGEDEENFVFDSEFWFCNQLFSTPDSTVYTEVRNL